MAMFTLVLSMAVVLAAISMAFGTTGGGGGGGPAGRGGNGIEWSDDDLLLLQSLLNINSNESGPFPMDNDQRHGAVNNQQNSQPMQHYAGQPSGFRNQQQMQPDSSSLLTPGYSDFFGSSENSASGDNRLSPSALSQFYSQTPAQSSSPYTPGYSDFFGSSENSASGDNQPSSSAPSQFYSHTPAQCSTPYTPGYSDFFGSPEFTNSHSGDNAFNANSAGSQNAQTSQQNYRYFQQINNQHHQQRGHNDRTLDQYNVGNFLSGSAAESSEDMAARSKDNLQIRYGPQESGCSLHINQLPLNHGVLTDVNKHQIRYPTQGDAIRFKQEQQIRFYCSGQNNSMRYFASDSLVIKCLNHMFFVQNADGSTTEFESRFSECQHDPVPVLRLGDSRRRTDFHACQGLKRYEVGIQLMTFKKFADVCVDDLEAGTVNVVFVKTVLNQKLKVQQPLGPVEEFYSDEGNAFQENEIAPLYNNEDIRISLIEQMGIEAYSMITSGNQFFITQGHLAGRYAWVYRTEHKTAFFWANIKPMWNNLKRNWSEVEMALSELAARRTESIVVYSGTHGMQSHPYLGGTVLSLDSNDFRKNRVIPAFFFKIVKDVATLQCITIVGYNSPYDAGNSRMCIPVEGLGYLEKVKPGIENGIVYACGCNEFHRYLYATKSPYFSSIPLEENIAYVTLKG